MDKSDPHAFPTSRASGAEVWFIGRLIGGFCIAAGVLGALTFGDWSGVPIGMFVLWQAWRTADQEN